MLLFSFLYVGPSLVGTFIFTDQVKGVGKYLHLIGIAGFLLGVFFQKKLSATEKSHRKSSIYNKFFQLKRVPAYVILFLGALFLIMYGLWSGVTAGLIFGRNVEGLRRSAEIGKGFIKEPGMFFINFVTLWLFGRTYLRSKKGSFSAIAILIGAWFFLFLTTAHKVPILYPLIIAIGLYNKFNRLSFLKMVSLGLILFTLIGLLHFVRGGYKINLGKRIMGDTLYFWGLYKYNYLPILDSIENGQMDLQYGREYINNSIVLIPRFLYPKKPLSFDYWLKEKLGYTFEGGGLPPTPFGSLYLNFGLTGVLFGMFLIGFLYNLTFRFYQNTPSLEKAIIALYLLIFLINPSNLIPGIQFLTFFILFILITNEIIIQATHHSHKIHPGQPTAIFS